MVHRMQEGEEALRWKRKFLDALEDHEQREKSLNNRIRLLRRGLLGVSLAGDGNDPVLDRQLTQLRSTLRNDDRETGLEALLEHIEKSIIRLDNEKNASTWALKQAFESSLKELEQVPLPGPSRRQLKKFSRSLSTRLEDPQQHTSLIRQFIELLSESVQALKAQEQQHLAASQPAAAISGGLWQRLFGANDPAAANQDAIAGELLDRDDDIGPSPHRSDNDATEDRKVRLETEAQEVDEEPHFDSQQNALNAAAATHKMSGRATDLEDSALRQQQVKLEADGSEDGSEDDSSDDIEGELIRDGSGLAEPAFSFIAGHVEPLLLRILESIHITGESVKLADTIRRHILKGLNWYDFVAVLEEILQILRHAADDQRLEFQDFLAEVNESLAQVQAFVDTSRKHADQSAATDAALDARVREQISGISNAVADSDADLDTLKVSVQSQIGAIISSLDTFKSQRQQQDDGMSSEMRVLIERISALETESRELRLHLSQQQERAQTDTLTDLPNREAYNQRLRSILQEWRDGARQERRDDDRSLCLAVADVDNFKQINDAYGHLAGDKVLKIISKELVSRLRDSDFVARYGGEEFVIIMPQTRPADAEHALNKVREAIAHIPFHFKERQLKITVSFGVSEAIHSDGPESLFDRADGALYKAKAEGRNRVHRARHES